MRRRSVAALCIALTTLTGLLWAPAAQAIDPEVVLLGLANARDYASVFNVDDPTAGYASGDNEVVRIEGGSVAGRRTGLPGAADLLLAGGSILVALPASGQIAVLDQSPTMTDRGRITVGANTCPRGLFSSGTFAWFFVGCSAPFRLARVETPPEPTSPLSNVETFNAPTAPSWPSPPVAAYVEEGGGGPSGWWIGSSGGLNKYSLAEPAPALLLAGPTIAVTSISPSATGPLLMAGGGTSFQIVNASTGLIAWGPFSAPLGFEASWSCCGLAPGVMIGVPGIAGPLQLRDIDTGAILGPINPPAGAAGLRPGTLLHNGNEVVGLWATSDGNSMLARLDARPVPIISVQAELQQRNGEVLARVFGTVKKPTGEPYPRALISIGLKDRSGTQGFEASVDSLGRFSELIPLDQPGQNVITVETDLPRTSVSVTIHVPARAWDLKGNGKARLVVSAPGEAIGDLTGAGSITVLGATKAGTPLAQGSKTWNQASAGVPGEAEKGDAFGRTVVSADFDADGYADLAVASPLENIGSTIDAGAVTILYGSATGVLAARSQAFDSRVGGITPARNGKFGWALAANDFNGDGFGDLAVGSPGQEAVLVLKGGSTGLSSVGVRSLTQATAGLPGTKAAGDSFGSSLASGDLTGDGRSDLVIGAPGDRDGHTFAAGSVTVLRGSSNGLTVTGARQITKESTGVQGSSTKDATHPDRFGESLAIGFLTTDDRMDLAIGSPGSPVGVSGSVRRGAGVVHILPGSATGVTATGDRLYSQETSGIGGTAGTDDRFGGHLDIGQTRPTYVGLLAIQSAGDQTVHVAPGVSAANEETFDQSSSGVPGTKESGDNFGTTLRFVGFTSAGWADLVIGVPGENSDAGAILVLRGALLAVTSRGSYGLSQASSGMVGSSESGDRWGWLGDSH